MAALQLSPNVRWDRLESVALLLPVSCVNASMHGFMDEIEDTTVALPHFLLQAGTQESH